MMKLYKPLGLIWLLLQGTVSYTQNVGIGTVSPITPLDIKSSTSAHLLRLDGPSSMYVSIYENGLYRGYLGSYTGNPEDVDFGTGAGNTTGKLHLTTQANPRLTIRENGYVGIGTTNPQWQLDVNGGMQLNGRLYVSGSSGTAGQVLTSNFLSPPSWQTLSTAFDNDIRFAVQTNQTSAGSGTTSFRTVLYNTNTTAIATPTSGVITIAQAGLYHFEGNFYIYVEYNGQTVGDNTNATGRLGVGLSQNFDTHYITSFKKSGIGSNWQGQEVFTWQKDIYITAGQVPINVSYGYVFNASPTNGAILSYRGMSGIISGYKIAD